MQQLIIEPGEVFSFWQLARGADHDDPYLPGLGCTMVKSYRSMVAGCVL